MKARGRYTAAIAGNVVTLTAKAGREDEDAAGDPAMLGTGTVVVNVGAPPVTGGFAFWKIAATGTEYLVEITRVG